MQAIRIREAISPSDDAVRTQLAEASRLAALGGLLVGAVNRIRNPLAATTADVGLAAEVVREVRESLREGTPGDVDLLARRLDAALEALDEAREGAQRIGSIVDDLSSYGRTGPGRGPVRLGEALQKALRWLPSSVGRVATVQVEDAGAPDIAVPAGHVEQVVLHLVTHAARAIRQGMRGAIVLWSGEGCPGMARLEVVDRAGGIDLALLERFLDPGAGSRSDGTALGLSALRLIVSSMGGTLSVATGGGPGLAFRVDLPAARPGA